MLTRKRRYHQGQCPNSHYPARTMQMENHQGPSESSQRIPSSTPRKTRRHQVQGKLGKGIFKSSHPRIILSVGKDPITLGTAVHSQNPTKDYPAPREAKGRSKTNGVAVEQSWPLELSNDNLAEVTFSRVWTEKKANKPNRAVRCFAACQDGPRVGTALCLE